MTFLPPKPAPKHSRQTNICKGFTWQGPASNSVLKKHVQQNLALPSHWRGLVRPEESSSPALTFVCSLQLLSLSAPASLAESPSSRCRSSAKCPKAATTSEEARSWRARSCHIMARSVKHCRASPSGSRTGSFCRATSKARMVSRRGRRDRWHRGHRNLASHSHHAGEGRGLPRRGQAAQVVWNQS